MLNHSNIVWVFPKKGSSSREEWRNFEKRNKQKKMNLTMLEKYDIEELKKWRNEFQIERMIDPPKLVKNSSNPFPRLISIPENGVKVRIFVKGRENENDLLEGNVVDVNKELKEADFFDFKIKRSSYNEELKIYEQWTLKFEVLDKNGNVINLERMNLYEMKRIQVVSHERQIEYPPLQIDQLVPPAGEINLEHRVLISGNFKYNPTIKVYFGGKAKSFERKTNGILLASQVSSNIPQQVPVYIQSKKSKSNELLFTFFNPVNLGREMGLHVSSDHPNLDFLRFSSKGINLEEFSFILNDGQTTQFPVSTQCSYPIFFFKCSQKYKLEKLKTIRDLGGNTTIIILIVVFFLIFGVFRIYILTLELWARRFTVNQIFS